MLPPIALLLASLAVGLLYSGGVGLLAYVPMLLSIDQDARHGQQQQQLNATTSATVFGVAPGGEAGGEVGGEAMGEAVWATHPLLLSASIASFGGALVCGTALLCLAATLGLASVRERPSLLGRVELWLGGTALLLCGSAAAAATAALGGGAETLIEKHCRSLLRQTDEACLAPNPILSRHRDRNCNPNLPQTLTVTLTLTPSPSPLPRPGSPSCHFWQAAAPSTTASPRAGRSGARSELRSGPRSRCARSTARSTWASTCSAPTATRSPRRGSVAPTGVLTEF